MQDCFMRIFRAKAAPDLNESAPEVCTLMATAFASRYRRGVIILLSLVVMFAAAAIAPAQAIRLSRAESLRIGRKIWQNECGGTIAGLTSWNVGENFASLGIGHFIWYPKGVRGPFAESFPQLVEFAAGRDARLPQILSTPANTGCPWKSRAEFLAANQTSEMKQLRQFLVDTVDLQAEFLAQRLQQALPKILAGADQAERAELAGRFDRVAGTAGGCYALVDYVNFKGEGLLDSERYQGQGWGLFQVLQSMSGDNTRHAAVEDFARAAREVLQRRVENSPPERGEARWLSGWLRRVNTYNQN